MTISRHWQRLWLLFPFFPFFPQQNNRRFQGKHAATVAGGSQRVRGLEGGGEFEFCGISLSKLTTNVVRCFCFAHVLIASMDRKDFAVGSMLLLLKL